jgi:maleamate amidohydrolase
MQRHCWIPLFAADCQCTYLPRTDMLVGHDARYGIGAAPGRILYSTADTRANGRVQATNRRVIRVDEQSYAIRDEFKPEADDLVIPKQRASAFYGTPILAHLNHLGVRSLIIVGESTSGCVRASTVDAYSSGFHTVVVEECTFDRHLLSHKVSLFDLHHKYADVMRVDEVVAHLNGLVGDSG